MKQNQGRMQLAGYAFNESGGSKTGYSRGHRQSRGPVLSVMLALVLIGLARVPTEAQVGKKADPQTKPTQTRPGNNAPAKGSRPNGNRARRSRKPEASALATARPNRPKRPRRVNERSTLASHAEQQGRVVPLASEPDINGEGASPALSVPEPDESLAQTDDLRNPLLEETAEDGAPERVAVQSFQGGSSFSEFPYNLGTTSIFGHRNKFDDLVRIADKRRAYVQTVNNEGGRKRIVSELTKYPGIEIVASPEDADFTISYSDKHGIGNISLAPNSYIPSVEATLAGRMSVSVRGEKKADGSYAQQVVWMDEDTRERLYWVLGGRHPATNLTRHLIKALKKTRGEK